MVDLEVAVVVVVDVNDAAMWYRGSCWFMIDWLAYLNACLTRPSIKPNVYFEGLMTFKTLKFNNCDHTEVRGTIKFKLTHGSPPFQVGKHQQRKAKLVSLNEAVVYSADYYQRSRQYHQHLDKLCTSN